MLEEGRPPVAGACGAVTWNGGPAAEGLGPRSGSLPRAKIAPPGLEIAGLRGRSAVRRSRVPHRTRSGPLNRPVGPFEWGSWRATGTSPLPTYRAASTCLASGGEGCPDWRVSSALAAALPAGAIAKAPRSSASCARRESTHRSRWSGSHCLPTSKPSFVRRRCRSIDPQVAAARERGLPVWKYSEAAGPPGAARAHARRRRDARQDDDVVDAVARAGRSRGRARRSGRSADSSAGTCRALRTNARWPGDDGWFCVEACEYDRTLPAARAARRGRHQRRGGSPRLLRHARGASRRPSRASSTASHPDGLLVLGREVPERVERGARAHGLAPGARARRRPPRRGARLLPLPPARARAGRRRRVQLAVPGRFNVENAALALALAVGVSRARRGARPGELAAAAARGLERFRGVARRFEPWGTSRRRRGRARLRAPSDRGARRRSRPRAARFPGRPLHVLFQPHQHSRTARFLDEFVESLRGADRVVVADVYGARAAHRRRAPCRVRAELVDAPDRRAASRPCAGGTAGSRALRSSSTRPARRAAALVLGAGDVGERPR